MDYATVGVDDKGRKTHICNFYQKVIRGGGIKQVKKHLAGVPGVVIACKKVTPEVRFTMQGILNETSQKSKSKATGSSSSVNILDDDDEDEDDLEKRNMKARSINEGKSKALTNLHPFFTKAHCLNLVLKDVSELDNMKSLVTLASRVTVFVYNHKWPLNWLRKRQDWTEIIRSGATRFGTTFIALKSLHDQKADLQAMIIYSEFKKMLKVKNASDCKQIVLNEVFLEELFDYSESYDTYLKAFAFV